MAKIESPITLVGLGRSGTTLIERAFASTSSVCSCGETGGIIFGTYAGALDSYFHSPGLRYDSRELFAADVVRRLFSSLFNISEASHWFHKPAGIPKMISWPNYKSKNDRFEFPTQWYWETLDAVFPNARYITVLRNPWDIVTSRMIFSGWPEMGGWDDIKIMYDFISARSHNMEILFFEDLVNDPYSEISTLFGKLGVEHDEKLKEVVSKKHVPTEKNNERNLLNELHGPEFDDATRELISNIWQSHGRKFYSPEGFRSFF